MQILTRKGNPSYFELAEIEYFAEFQCGKVQEPTRRLKAKQGDPCPNNGRSHGHAPLKLGSANEKLSYLDLNTEQTIQSITRV